MKIIALGDIHATLRTPENRKDKDYPTTLLNKLEFVFQYAKDNGIEVILQPGDLFDSAKANHDLVARVAEVIKKFSPKVRMYCCVGQHDTHFHNLKNPNMPIKVLDKAKVIQLLTTNPTIIYDRNGDFIHAYGASWGEDIPKVNNLDVSNVLVTHRMIVYNKKIWEGQTDYDSAKPLLFRHDFNIIISGDNHNRFAFTDNNRVLVNAGSIMRSTTIQKKHTPSFYIVDTVKHTKKQIKIPVKKITAVMDFSKKEQEEKIDKSLESFVKMTDSLQSDKISGLNYKKNVDIAMKDKTIESGVKAMIVKMMDI